MPPKQKRSAAKFKEDNGGEEAESGTKRAKHMVGTKKTPAKKSQREIGKKFTDENGNSYWEVC